MRSNHGAACVALAMLSFLIAASTARAQATALPSWDPAAAARYLDGKANWWTHWPSATRGQGTTCISCHTTLPYALVRPALGQQLGEKEPGPAETRVFDILKKRVDNWEAIAATGANLKDPFVPFYSGSRRQQALGTEAVLNAVLLVNFDAHRNGGKLSPHTTRALSQLWPQQQENGAWLWLEFGLRPWENEGTYFGAALAALAVGTAGKDYHEQPEIQPRLTALKTFLNTQTASQPLHHRTVALWASSVLPGILTGQRKPLQDELLAAQEADGGWCITRLGRLGSGKNGWKAHGSFPEKALSDGYATGLVVVALRRSGLAANHPALEKAVAWLAGAQQGATWPATYPNRERDPQSDVGNFMRNASTAFAILALTEAGPGAVPKKAD